LISSNRYVLIPQEETSNNHKSGVSHNSQRNSNTNDASINDAARVEKKRKREERKKKYLDRRKEQKEKERAKKEEEEFNRQLQAKLGAQCNDKSIEDLPQEYRKLIGGDLEHTHLVKGIDWNLLRQTKENMARQQILDIENAYHDAAAAATRHTAADDHVDGDDDDDDVVMDTTTRTTTASTSTDDVSDLMRVRTQWADAINKCVSKYFSNHRHDHAPPTAMHEHAADIKRNPKFCHGMLYRFHIDDEDDDHNQNDDDDEEYKRTSIPTEIIRSRVAYGLQLDHDWNDDAFGDDDHDGTLGAKLCSGYTPPNVIHRIANALLRAKDDHNNGNTCDAGKKRTFSQMNDTNTITAAAGTTSNEDGNTGKHMNEDNTNAAADDFDIFGDAGRDYVCDPKDHKRRRVAFAAEPNTIITEVNTPASYFERNNNAAEHAQTSEDKHTAASILKSSLNKAKIENLKLKRNMILHSQELSTSNAMPTLEANDEKNNHKKKAVAPHSSSLRGKLLSSGFSTFDDDDDDDEAEESSKSAKSMTAARADQQWKKLQEKFGDKKKISKNIQEKLK